ncbi:GLPGLI family protein [Winogradskyella maritima]|uniref:GLPGLI family protein n=1 Tax=Winogradskyella maritima TaxID=1517766 RepID=A0ABV8AHD5_9FLAO|nr:GLPGLI family protein [Winogradskyella maritima]
MKKLVLLLLVVGFSITHAQTKGKITYRFSILKDSIKPLDSLKSLDEVKVNVHKMLMNAEPIEAYLLFNKQKSFFYVEPRLNPSPPIWNHASDGIGLERADYDMGRILAGGDGTYYTDWSDNFMTHQMNFMENKLRVISKAPDWELIDSTKIILDYPCKLAKSKKGKIFAWYTESIPYKHGPRDSSNLPGMVLEVRRGRMHIYTAINIDYNDEEADFISEPVEGKLVTQNELRSIAGNPFGKKD